VDIFTTVPTVQYFLRNPTVKEFFENRVAFDQVMMKRLRGCFYNSVYTVHYYSLTKFMDMHTKNGQLGER